ncbi:sensor histidine kinase [Streptomyces sp. NPDC057654]|uniref:sensor histidine kinase n=1 Tax=Streptomyces sp. NPDC057654 TaxID=3346196 RepID=UPI003681C1D6
MPVESWTAWPYRESLSHEGVPRRRIAMNQCVRFTLVVLIAWRAFQEGSFHGWALLVLAGGIVVFVVVARGYFRSTLEHRLLPSLGLLGLLFALGIMAHLFGAHSPARSLWAVGAILAVERLPMAYALPAAAAHLLAYGLLSEDRPIVTAGTCVGLALVGYALRLDAEARGSGFRLLAQERVARAAEAESAALAERARIAREIHDVLAHSLSAQLVHLEAARLLIERGENDERILERVVLARGMAREGLAETRQALSALRGEMAQVGDFLREVADSQGAAVEVTGEPRKLPAEAGLAVRRVAQEALTNVRKHAPGAHVRVRFAYLDGEVELEVRDGGARQAAGGLASTGSGYGLLGMRERAELLGGTLETGPAGPGREGFVVRLRVPG